MTIRLKQVIEAIEEANEDFKILFDTKTGETIYLNDSSVFDMTDEDKALICEIEDTPDGFILFPSEYDIHRSLLYGAVFSRSPGAY